MRFKACWGGVLVEKGLGGLAPLRLFFFAVLDLGLWDVVLEVLLRPSYLPPYSFPAFLFFPSLRTYIHKEFP